MEILARVVTTRARISVLARVVNFYVKSKIAIIDAYRRHFWRQFHGNLIEMKNSNQNARTWWILVNFTEKLNEIKGQMAQDGTFKM